MSRQPNVVDQETPTGEFLRGHYKKSFGYYTLSSRIPTIINEIIASLGRNEEQIVQKYGEPARLGLQTILEKIKALKSDLESDQELKPFEKELDKDIPEWNRLLEGLDSSQRTFFTTVWLYAECYIYRRLKYIFQESSTLKDFDYFSEQKNKSLFDVFDSVKEVAEVLARRTPVSSEESKKVTLIKILKLNLWGNKCDLSLKKEVNQCGDPFEVLATLEPCILVDQTADIFDCLKAQSSLNEVEIVLDNAGYELFTDLVLADYLLYLGLAQSVTFTFKMIPWFVSDALTHDLDFLLETFGMSDDSNVSALAIRWKSLLEAGKFKCEFSDHFWTSAYDFAPMAKVDPRLYERLGKRHLVIFKGDLNYRKLMGDINHDPTIGFKQALRGFQPSNVCSLRTVKADVISGLPNGKAEELTAKDPNWMRTGEYGVIQFAPK